MAGTAQATLTASFATSAAGALGPGATVTLLAPPGTTLPATASDYSLSAGTGSATVSSVVPAAVGGSPGADKTTVTLATSSIGDLDLVSLAVAGATVPPAAGTSFVALSTSADPVPVDPAVTIGPAGASATRSSVTASAPSAPADGVTTEAVTVSVADAYANPVPGQTVTLSAAGSSATVSPPTAVTSPAGTATFSVTDPAAQAVTLSATSTPATGHGGVTLRPLTVTFTNLSGLTYQLLLTGTSHMGDTTAGDKVTVTASFNLEGGISGSTGSITLTAPAGTTLPATTGSYSVEDLDTDVAQPVTKVSVSEGPGSATTNVAAIHFTPTRLETPDTVVQVTVAGATNPTASGTGYASVTASGAGNTVASTSAVTITPAAATAAASTVTAAAADVVANGTSAALVTVAARDAHGNPVPGQVVTLGQGGGNSTVTGDGSTPKADQSTTSSSGTATFSVRDATAEDVTYSATDSTTGITLTQQTSVTFTAPGAPSGLSVHLSNPGAGAAPTVLSATFTTSPTGSLAGGAAGTPTITLTAPSWAPLPARSSAYQVSDTTSGNDPVRQVTVTGGVRASVVLGDSGIAAGDVVTVSIGGLTNPEPAKEYPVTVSTSADTTAITATASVGPGQPSPARSTTSATPTSVPADGTSQSTVAVTERDAFTDLVPGDTVTLTPSPGSHATVTPPTATASSTGVATFTVTDTAVEAVTLTPTDTTAAVTLPSAGVDFTRPGGQTSVTGVAVAPGPPTTAFVAGAATTYDVSFTTSATGGLGPGSTVSVAGPSGTSWPSTAADYQLTGSVAAGVSGSGTDGSPLVVVLGPTTVAADQRASLVVQGVHDPTAASADETVALSTSADAAAAVSGTYAVVAGPPFPGSTVTTSSAAAPIGGSVSVTVTELDAYANPVIGDTVALTAQSGSHAVITPPTATTSGTGSATFTVSDPAVETATLTAADTSADVTFSERPSVAFVTPDVAHVAVTPTPLVAGTISTLSVTFTTSAAGGLTHPQSTISIIGPATAVWPTAAADYDVSGQSAVTTSVSGLGTSSSPLVITLTSSQIHGGTAVTLTVHGVVVPTVAKQYQVEVRTSADDGAFIASEPFEVGAAAPSATRSTVDASATSAMVGSPVTLTVTVEDAFGNQIAGDTVTVSTSPGTHATVSPPSAATSSAGVATFTVTDPVAEVVTLSASESKHKVTFSESPSVTFVAPAPPVPRAPPRRPRR